MQGVKQVFDPPPKPDRPTDRPTEKSKTIQRFTNTDARGGIAMSQMTRADFDYAIEELEARFEGMRIGDREKRAYADTLRPFDAQEIFAAIDRIARAGRPRPKPNQITESIHAARPKQRQGPFLEDDGWRDGMVPANEPGWHEAAAEARRRLTNPTDDERAEAYSVAAQKRSEDEVGARPEWWGKA